MMCSSMESLAVERSDHVRDMYIMVNISIDQLYFVWKIRSAAVRGVTWGHDKRSKCEPKLHENEKRKKTEEYKIR